MFIMLSDELIANELVPDASTRAETARMEEIFFIGEKIKNRCAKHEKNIVLSG